MNQTLIAPDMRKPSLALALARTRDLIDYFRRTPEKMISLNAVICPLYNEDRPTPPVQSVHSCGAAGCIGGHTFLRYAPITMVIDQHGDAKTQKGNPVDILDAAGVLLRQDGDAFYGTYTEKLFEGAEYGVPERQTALRRLRTHRENLKKRIAAGER